MTKAYITKAGQGICQTEGMDKCEGCLFNGETCSLLTALKDDDRVAEGGLSCFSSDMIWTNMYETLGGGRFEKVPDTEETSACERCFFDNIEGCQLRSSVSKKTLEQVDRCEYDGYEFKEVKDAQV